MADLAALYGFFAGAGSYDGDLRQLLAFLPSRGWADFLVSVFSFGGERGRFSFIGGWLSAQIAMMVLLLPLQFLLFHGLSLSSLFGNAVAIPVVSWLAVPLILCGLITLGVPAISSVFWWLADRSISFMMAALGYLEFGWIEVSTYGVVLSFLGWGVAVAGALACGTAARIH